MQGADALDADAVFTQLEAVENLFLRLQRSALWKSEGSRLPAALQDITGALAEAAFTDFPDDQRRWRAGAMLFGLTAAFKDAASGEPSATWGSMMQAAESTILASPQAPDVAAAAAFRYAASRALKDLDASEPEDRHAALLSYDALLTRLARPEYAMDTLPRLVGILEQHNMYSELLPRLQSMASSKDDRVRAFGEGRLLVLESREAPLNITFKDISGAEIDLSAFRNEVVLLQFWASWCSPCRDEIPFVRSAYRRFNNSGFQVVGVSLDKLENGESHEAARLRVEAFMKQNGMDWPSQFDGLGWQNACAKQLGVRSIPASLLLDREGRVAALNVRGEAIAQEVEHLLGGMESLTQVRVGGA